MNKFFAIMFLLAFLPLADKCSFTNTPSSMAAEMDFHPSN